MGKGARNRKIRQDARLLAVVTPGHGPKRIARALRKGRMPLAAPEGQRVSVTSPRALGELLQKRGQLWAPQQKGQT